jgi:hypothetical protein
LGGLKVILVENEDIAFAVCHLIDFAIEKTTSFTEIARRKVLASLYRRFTLFVIHS